MIHYQFLLAIIQWCWTEWFSFYEQLCITKSTILSSPSYFPLNNYNLFFLLSTLLIILLQYRIYY